MYVYNNYSNFNRNFDMSYADAATDNQKKPAPDATLDSSPSLPTEGPVLTEDASKANPVVLADSNNPAAEVVVTT